MSDPGLTGNLTSTIVVQKADGKWPSRTLRAGKLFTDPIKWTKNIDDNVPMKSRNHVLHKLGSAYRLQGPKSYPRQICHASPARNECHLGDQTLLSATGISCTFFSKQILICRDDQNFSFVIDPRLLIE